MAQIITRILIALIICTILSGCASPYMKNRGNDLADIVDVGITANGGKPQFGLFLDFFNITPLGWSGVETTKIGLQHRHFGVMPYENKSWGLLLWGEELRGAEEFNPLDPHQARRDQSDLTERPAFDAGIVSLIEGDETPPVVQFLECERGFHLGWIGLQVTCRPVDLLDFIIGLATLDILGDDLVEPVAE